MQSELSYQFLSALLGLFCRPAVFSYSAGEGIIGYAREKILQIQGQDKGLLHMRGRHGYDVPLMAEGMRKW